MYNKLHAAYIRIALYEMLYVHSLTVMLAVYLTCPCCPCTDALHICSQPLNFSKHHMMLLDKGIPSSGSPSLAVSSSNLSVTCLGTRQTWHSGHHEKAKRRFYIPVMKGICRISDTHLHAIMKSPLGGSGKLSSFPLRSSCFFQWPAAAWICFAWALMMQHRVAALRDSRGKCGTRWMSLTMQCMLAAIVLSSWQLSAVASILSLSATSPCCRFPSCGACMQHSSPLRTCKKWHGWFVGQTCRVCIADKQVALGRGHLSLGNLLAEE